MNNIIEKYGIHDLENVFVTLDGHAWCLGIDLLKCKKIDTGDRIKLQYSWGFEKRECEASIYRLVYDEETFRYSGLPEDVILYVAIGEEDGVIIVHNHNRSFDDALRYSNRNNDESK